MNNWNERKERKGKNGARAMYGNGIRYRSDLGLFESILDSIQSEIHEYMLLNNISSGINEHEANSSPNHISNSSLSQESSLHIPRTISIVSH